MKRSRKLISGGFSDEKVDETESDVCEGLFSARFEDLPERLRGMSLPQFAEEMTERICEYGAAKITLPPISVIGDDGDEGGKAVHEMGMPTGQLIQHLLGSSTKVDSYIHELQLRTSVYAEAPGDTHASGNCYRARCRKRASKSTVAAVVARCENGTTAYHTALAPDAAKQDRSIYWAATETIARKGQKVEYAADIPATVTNKLTGFPEGWNMGAWSPSNELLRAASPWLGFAAGISGVTDPYVYIGGPGSTFFLHAEDQNLSSCNYLIDGAPKIWYTVPSKYYDRVVQLAKRMFADDKLVCDCPQALLHKQFMIEPKILVANGIPVYEMVQNPGDMIITAPGSFHFGYNAGLNLAEATNFATPSWWNAGHFSSALSAGKCTCKSSRRFHFDEDAVQIALAKMGAPFGVHIRLAD